MKSARSTLSGVWSSTGSHRLQALNEATLQQAPLDVSPQRVLCVLSSMGFPCLQGCRGQVGWSHVAAVCVVGV